VYRMSPQDELLTSYFIHTTLLPVRVSEM
jgi:hypothetical protein